MMGIVVMCWCVAGTGGVTEEQVVVVPLDLVQYDQHQAAFNTVLHHFGECDATLASQLYPEAPRWPSRFKPACQVMGSSRPPSPSQLHHTRSSIWRDSSSDLALCGGWTVNTTLCQSGTTRNLTGAGWPSLSCHSEMIQKVKIKIVKTLAINLLTSFLMSTKSSNYTQKMHASIEEVNGSLKALSQDLVILKSSCLICGRLPRVGVLEFPSVNTNRLKQRAVRSFLSGPASAAPSRPSVCLYQRKDALGGIRELLCFSLMSGVICIDQRETLPGAEAPAEGSGRTRRDSEAGQSLA
ncbi:hypothetical protein E2C01_011939 [Portunus trituberculatus]|uniref:Uncharacterized protein n=1 Tax=Portunus trituberculatus TaxID=210409 RepID=A0A5B7DCP1_PORTR|nr:hypothetical protein [Portunus trituberculatus]